MGKELNSSNLKYVEYDSTSNTMSVEFHNGSIYEYNPISEEGYKALCNAESPGKYFSEFIRNNKNITANKVRAKS